METNKKIIYKNVYFRIECGYIKTDGYDHSDECMTEIARQLQEEGWNIKELSRISSGGCPEATLRKMYLYVHPQSVSGTVEPDQIPVIEKMLKTGKSYQYQNTDIYQDVHDLSWEELADYHREHNGQTIMALLLETFKTKRSNLYKPVKEVINHIADKIRIDTLLKNGCNYAVTCEGSVVREIYCNLVDGGYIITAKGRNDTPIARTATKNDTMAETASLF